jgi:hypothetical protein
LPSEEEIWSDMPNLIIIETINSHNNDRNDLTSYRNSVRLRHRSPLQSISF